MGISLQGLHPRSEGAGLTGQGPTQLLAHRDGVGWGGLARVSAAGAPITRAAGDGHLQQSKGLQGSGKETPVILKGSGKWWAGPDEVLTGAPWLT